MWAIAGVKVRDLWKIYRAGGREVPVLQGLSFEMDREAVTVILGRSGCGKTTFLRIVSGLEKEDRGEVLFPGKPKTGIVFQEPRLMPWLSVRNNITFGMRKREKDSETIDRLICMAGLAGFERARPCQLSGGMQQRTALARALAYDPDFLLMDEPFAALDHFTRKAMQEELLRIQGESRKGVAFVTHSIDEALILGAKIIVLEGGKSKKEYDLNQYPYPRDLLSGDLIALKRDIIGTIEEGGEIR